MDTVLGVLAVFICSGTPARLDITPEACRSRIEDALEQTDIGRLRKERAAARKDDQLTHALEVEDALVQEEAKKSAIASGADVGTGDGGDAREETDTKHERGADPTVDIDDGDTLRPVPSFRVRGCQLSH